MSGMRSFVYSHIVYKRIKMAVIGTKPLREPMLTS